jgi:hypothetical protein
MPKKMKMPIEKNIMEHVHLLVGNYMLYAIYIQCLIHLGIEFRPSPSQKPPIKLPR